MLRQRDKSARERQKLGKTVVHKNGRVRKKLWPDDITLIKLLSGLWGWRWREREGERERERGKVVSFGGVKVISKLWSGVLPAGAKEADVIQWARGG